VSGQILPPLSKRIGKASDGEERSWSFDFESPLAVNGDVNEISFHHFISYGTK
jgi:hypothetical protein